jgi:hypothetical protein
MSFDFLYLLFIFLFFILLIKQELNIYILYKNLYFKVILKIFLLRKFIILI